MGAIKVIYDMIPKWLLLILLIGFIALSGWYGVKCQYLRIDNAKLANDNKILTDNAVILNSKLSTCTKSLAAEAENAKKAEKINAKMRDYKVEISKICVKEPTDEKEKSGIKDAIDISNRLSDAVNKLRAGEDNSE
jgi:hypothetical protein